MKILLNQDEIIEAVESQVRSQIAINDDQEITVEFKAGRGDNGMEATIDIRAKTKHNTAKSKPVTRRSAVTEASTAIVNGTAENVAQAEEQTFPGDIIDEAPAGITSNPEDRQPPAPKVNSMFGVSKPTLIVEEAGEAAEAMPAEAAAEPAPVAVAAKKPSIFGGFPKAGNAA